jgi:arabinan endo-1,5-alpha-L-arabinosidase
MNGKIVGRAEKIMNKEKYVKIRVGPLIILLIVAILLLGTGTSENKAIIPEKPQRVSVHDPSIIKDGKNGIYYVLGSHAASARSTDLINWIQLSGDYEYPDNEPFFGNLGEKLEESFKWAGYNDGDATGRYAVWAPDIVYNPGYDWGDGTRGAYMLYYCTSSTWRRSCIGYLVSRTISGNYRYRDTIVYSGFTRTGATDGNSTRNTRWDNDYLNLKKLVAKGSKNGGIDGIKDDRCFNADGSWNNLYAPNAIDPTVFFDATGSKMYMVYGSWSGGIFILEIDPATGEPRYPGIDSTDPVSGNYTDRYFGTHIAGGNHQSGEGPFILYDNDTGYYYLYESYGGLSARGGYNMRLFRSRNVMGPYTDAAGRNAANSGASNYKYGIKIMGNYKFHDQQGKRSAGGNCAMIDDNDWPVTAVYENRNEKIAHYSNDEVIGNYEFINHGTAAADWNMLDTRTITLNQDGSVSGDATGTWQKTRPGSDYDYITLKLWNTTYKGIFFRQYDEETIPREKMTFTAIGNNNTTVWGSMMDAVTIQANKAPSGN